MTPTPKEIKWLAHFASGERERPFGMGPCGVSNFVGRKWILRIERAKDFGPELYRLTPYGLTIYETHQVRLKNS